MKAVVVHGHGGPNSSSLSGSRGRLRKKETGMKTGQKAPDFSVKDDSGKTVRLSDFKGKKVVLYFYPKDDTPGCTTSVMVWLPFERKAVLFLA